MQHLVLSQDRACAQLFQSRSTQTWLIAGEERGWWEPLVSALQKSPLHLKPMGAVLWVHGDFYTWAIGVLIVAPRINWSFWHLSLCSCVSHPEGSHWWEVSWFFPNQESWPEVTGGLRRCMQPSFYLCVQTRRLIQLAALRTLQWVVETQSSLSAFTMDSECDAEQITYTQLFSSGHELFPFVCRGSQPLWWPKLMVSIADI